DRELADGLVRLLALVAVEGVGAEDGAFHDGLRPLSRGEPVAEHLGGHRARAEIAGPADRRRARAAQHFGGRLGRLADPGDRDARAVVVGMRALPRLCRELLEVEHSLELSLRRAIETRQALRQLRLADVEADDERVGRDLLQPLGDDLDFHPRVPPLSAWAARIMSMSPWVVSSSATRSTSNPCASAASSPASTSSESGYAR